MLLGDQPLEDHDLLVNAGAERRGQGGNANFLPLRRICAGREGRRGGRGQ